MQQMIAAEGGVLGEENSVSPESPVTASEHRGPRDKPNIYGQTSHSLIFFL